GLAANSGTAPFRWRQVLDPGENRLIDASEVAAAARHYSPATVFRDYYDEACGADWLDRLLFVDSQTWLRDDVLVKVNRASMAASLECRSPFLDYRVVEL